MGVVMVMFRADGQRRSFSITRDMTVVGRREDCDLRIPLSDVSRKHCRLVKDDGSLKVEDLGSSNGTYRNGERVQEAPLEPGDNIKVGPVWFVVQIDGSPAEEDIQPPAIPAPAEAAATDESGELEVVEDLPTEELAEAPAEGGEIDEFDPMSALAGSDSGIEMEAPPPGDSMQIDLEESGHEEK